MIKKKLKHFQELGNSSIIYSQSSESLFLYRLWDCLLQKKILLLVIVEDLISFRILFEIRCALSSSISWSTKRIVTIVDEKVVLESVRLRDQTVILYRHQNSLLQIHFLLKLLLADVITLCNRREHLIHRIFLRCFSHLPFLPLAEFLLFFLLWTLFWTTAWTCIFVIILWTLKKSEIKKHYSLSKTLFFLLIFWAISEKNFRKM